MLDVVMLCAALMTGGEGKKGDDCPHHSVENIPVRVDAQLPQECGTGFNFKIEGFAEHKAPNNMCPKLVLVHPGHSIPKPLPESGTYARQTGTLNVVQIDFECVEHWILGILPIVISSSCQEVGRSNMGTVANFAAIGCERDKTEQ